MSAWLEHAREAAAAVGGYAWWYVEVHDIPQGRFGLTLILFAGSVFSPHYAARRRAGEAVCGLAVPAVNCALYERTRGAYPTTQRAWVMNEYPPAALQLGGDAVRVAKSAMRFAADGSVAIELAEHTTRFFGRRGPRLCGRLTLAAAPPRLDPLCLGQSTSGAAHYWQPLAARAAATVELELGGKRLAFQGLGYCDRNYGHGPLEDTFARWGWAHGFPRAQKAGEEGALIVYNTTARSGHGRQLSVRFADSHSEPEVTQADTSPAAGAADDAGDLLWLRVPRSFVAGPYTCQRVAGGTLEDTPFYARFAVELGAPAAVPRYDGVGEYLDLERFRQRPLQHLLRYKTRRTGADSLP